MFFICFNISEERKVNSVPTICMSPATVMHEQPVSVLPITDIDVSIPRFAWNNLCLLESWQAVRITF